MKSFWRWYEWHYTLHVGLTAVLFLWQIFHLYWLGADVIAPRLTGVSYFHPNTFFRYLLIVVDYTEIPAIISTSLLYLFELQRPASAKATAGKPAKILLLLLLLNSQWLHLFWITDEFVVSTFRAGGVTVLPAWLAWAAILIDYLEIPVIIDIIWRFLRRILRYETHQPSVSE